MEAAFVLQELDCTVGIFGKHVDELLNDGMAWCRGFALSVLLLIRCELQILQRNDRFDREVGVEGDAAVGFRCQKGFRDDEDIAEEEQVAILDRLKATRVSGIFKNVRPRNSRAS